MKSRDYFLLVFILITLSCKAQSPIVHYNTSNIPENAYCKDLNNDLDKFTGTWRYNSGNTELTVVIVKNEQVNLGSYYIDELAGNYKYIENGVEIINTLNEDYNEDASFSGDDLLSNTNLFKIAYFTDPGKPRASYKLDLEYLGTDLFTGNIQLKWKLKQTEFYSGYVPGETPPTPAELDQTIRLPREVILVKQ